MIDKISKELIMSGGSFDYSQRTIELIADDIEQTILEAGRKIPSEILKEQQSRYSRVIPIEEQYYRSYNRKTMEIMKRAVYILRMAYIYAQRIDWMLSDDDGEDDLVIRLEKELQELKTKYPSGKFTFKKNKVRYDDDIKQIKMNKNNKQSDREILEEILKILRNLTVSPIVVQDPMKLYNNKELMELLGVKDRYLKKLRDNGYLGYSREGDKYWYTQKDVDCFLRSFHYEPFNRDRNKLWTL